MSRELTPGQLKRLNRWVKVRYNLPLTRWERFVEWLSRTWAIVRSPAWPGVGAGFWMGVGILAIGAVGSWLVCR